MRAGYRLRQMAANLTARPSAADLQEATLYLSPREEHLFLNLAAADQAHSLRVLRSLLSAGEREPDLLAAALLHDLGKSIQPLQPWERALAVITGRLAPGLAARWGRGEPIGWRRPFVVARQHPAWGAGLLEQAGSSERVQWLVRHHQDEPNELGDGDSIDELRRLQAADDRN